MFLSASTGQFRVEGKTIVNNELGYQIMSGVPAGVAGFEVTKELHEKGVWMRPNAELAKNSKSLGYRNTLRVMSIGIANLKVILLDVTSNPIFGGPVILPLVVLGLFCNPWTSSRASGELMMFLTVAASLVATTTIIQHFASRFYYFLSPFLILWAAKGVRELAEWAHATSLTLRVPHLLPRTLGMAVGGLALVGLILIFVVGGFHIARVEPMDLEVKRAGEWLATLPGKKTIMDTTVETAFRAAAKYVPLPWSDADTALRYADFKGVNFIVVKSWDRDARPYLRDWIKSERAGANMPVVRTFGTEPDAQVLVFARH
jgi:hypothetical protein